MESISRTGPQADEAGLATNLLALSNAVRKHWATSLGVLCAVVLGTAFHTLGQTKIYQAVVTIQFDPNPPRPLGKSVDMVVDMGAGNYWNNREYYETQYKVIRTLRVAMPVVLKLNLHQDATFIQNQPASPHAKPVSVSPEEASEILVGRLSVEPIKDSRLATVKYEDADAARAQRVLTALVESYIEQNLDYSHASTSSAVVWLREQTDKLRNELETSERELHKYKLDKNILSLDPDAQSNMLRQEMKQLNDELTSVRAKREGVSARRSELAKVAADDPSNLPALELLSSPLIQQLRQRYDDATRDRAGLLGSGKGSSHPDVASADARVTTTRNALLGEIRNVQKAADRELASVTKQEAGLAKLFESAKRRALELNLLEVDYNRLRRTRDNTEKLYSMVLDRTKESDLARMMSVNNIRLVDRALQPREPVRPRVGLSLSFGVLLGLALGVAAALGRTMLDRTIKTPHDVETELGVSFLGLLPEIGSSTTGAAYYGRRRRRKAHAGIKNIELIVHEAPSSGVAEAARAVRTNLMFMTPDEPLHTLLITSPAPAEGKTTVAVSIAIAMAQAGQRVVLVDCDLRRPRVHRVFGRTNDTGVTSALLEGAAVESVATSTEVPNLSIIPAGPIPPNPAELFHSDRFRAFLAKVSEHFDRVIVDSPPVVTVTDAAILSTLVDGVLLVVRAFSTKKDLARHAVRAIQDVGGKALGVVLNAVNLDRHEYKYHYYYYRRDDYYLDPKAAAEASEARAPVQ